MQAWAKATDSRSALDGTANHAEQSTSLTTCLNTKGTKGGRLKHVPRTRGRRKSTAPNSGVMVALEGDGEQRCSPPLRWHAGCTITASRRLVCRSQFAVAVVIRAHAQCDDGALWWCRAADRLRACAMYVMLARACSHMLCMACSHFIRKHHGRVGGGGHIWGRVGAV